MQNGYYPKGSQRLLTQRAKRRTLCALLGALLFILAACAPRAGVGHNNAKPSSGVRGYYGTGQDFRGGQAIDLINIRTLDVSQKGKDTTLTFSFVQGSARLGMEERAPSSLPMYTVSLLDKPYRLAIRIESVSYWDYQLPELSDYPLLGQSFLLSPPQGGAAVFYLHLNQKSAFSLEEEDNRLSVRITQDASDDQQPTYHVVYNAFTEYQQQAVLRGLGFAPSLCSDVQHAVLLSPPFASEEQAQGYLTQHSEQITQELPDKIPQIIQLAPGQLPDYNLDTDLAEAVQKRVMQTTQGERSLPALQIGAQLLGFSKDGKRAVYAKTVQQHDDALGMDVYRDQIWLWNQGEELVQLPLRNFLSIAAASLSPDGRYVAIAEGAESMRPLYIYDLQDGQLYSAGEEGLGMTTWGFAWDENSQAIYAMSGETVPAAGAVSYQLKKYDLTQPIGQRVSALEELPGNDSNVGVAGGYIYFVQSSYDSPQILRVSTQGGERSVYAKGGYFQISPDQSSMWVSEGIQGDAPQGGDAVLYTLADGTSRIIAQDVMISDVVFTSDGRKVVYLADTMENTLYPLDLMVYDLATQSTRRLGAVRAGCTLHTGGQANQVILIDVHQNGQDYIPVTYLLDLAL